MTEPAPGDFGSLRCSFADLARKYASLLHLRSPASRFDPVQLRALAREFPGALRELDALPHGELRLRAELAQRSASSGAALEPLLDWIRCYHETMRLALWLRARLGKERAPHARLVAELVAACATAQGGTACDANFVTAVASPPGGRLNSLVFARLADRFGSLPTTVERRLFRAEAA